MQLYETLYRHYENSDLDLIIDVLNSVCEYVDSEMPGNDVSDWLANQSYKLDELASSEVKNPEYVAWLNLFREKDD